MRDGVTQSAYPPDCHTGYTVYRKENALPTRVPDKNLLLLSVQKQQQQKLRAELCYASYSYTNSNNKAPTRTAHESRTGRFQLTSSVHWDPQP
jgi:hypothetical protein